jgi:hypothetical protein
VQVHDSTNAAQNPLARSSHQVSEVPYGLTTATFTPLPCLRCATVDQSASGPGNGQHCASAWYHHCGHGLAWISQDTPAGLNARRQQTRKQTMAQRPPGQAQLTYLPGLGDDTCLPPAPMAEASTRIDTLAHREVGP